MRRHQVVALALAVFVGGTASAALVGHWTLDETGTPATVADSSGNGLTGTVYGATPAAGAIDGAMHFDGTDDYIEMAPNGVLDIAGAITIAFWIRPDTWDARGMWMTNVLGKRMDGAPHPYQVVLTGDGSLQFAYYSTEWTHVETADALVPVDTWTHVALTRDAGGTQIQVYTNGTLLETLAIPAPGAAGALNGGYGLQMGRAVQPQDDNNNWFLGALDDVRIYDSVLSAQEITDIHNTDSTPVVSVTADDPTSAEDGDAGSSSDTASFTFTRTGATDEDLALTFTLTDAVASGAGDYDVQGATFLSGTTWTVTIGTGSATASVTLVPANDDLEEAAQSVDAEVLPGTGYVVSSGESSATATVTDDDISAPGAFTLQTPVGGSQVPYDADLDLVWTEPTASMFSPTVYDVTVADNASFVSPVLELTGVSIVAAGGLCQVTLDADDLVEGTDYWWSVTASNDGGPTDASNAPETFAAAPDTTAPYVTFTTPSPGSKVAPEQFTIRIQFSEPIALNGPADAAVSVTCLTGTVTTSGDSVLVFTPDQEPAYDASFVVSVSPAITDAASVPNALDGDGGALSSYSFTVKTETMLTGLGAGVGCTHGESGSDAAFLWLLLVGSTLSLMRGLKTVRE